MGIPADDAPGAPSRGARTRPRNAAPTKNPDSAQSMVARNIRRGPTSHAEALKELRAAFPDSPLTMRVAALAILMRRGAGDHIPR
jgi:hypothetical protein